MLRASLVEIAEALPAELFGLPDAMMIARAALAATSPEPVRGSTVAVHPQQQMEIEKIRELTDAINGHLSRKIAATEPKGSES